MRILPIIALLLSGCAASPAALLSRAPETGLDRPAAASVDIGIDWNWRTVGDAAVRPVQVFSLGEQTYLQFKDNRPVALVVSGQVVPYTPNWPYLVIQGVPDQVDIVADGFRAVAEYVGRPPVPRKIIPDDEGRIERVNIHHGP